MVNENVDACCRHHAFPVPGLNDSDQKEGLFAQPETKSEGGGKMKIIH